MTEVRTTSSTGGEKGMKPQRYDLLPKPALDAIAEVYAFGATKYKDHNWRLGYEWSKSYAAAMRHLTAFWEGETHDEESGLPHLAHAGFHVFAMLTWLAQQGEGGEFDDRYRPPVKEEETLDLTGTTSLTFELRNVDPDFFRLYYGSPVERFYASEHGATLFHEDGTKTHLDPVEEEIPTVNEDPQPLGEGWEDVGYTTEGEGLAVDWLRDYDAKHQPFEQHEVDLEPYRDILRNHIARINREVTAQVTMRNAEALRRQPEVTDDLRAAVQRAMDRRGGSPLA